MAEAGGEAGDEVVRELLWQAATRFAEGFHIQMTPDALEFLETTLARVAERLEREGKLDDEPALAQARTAVYRWLANSGSGPSRQELTAPSRRADLTAEGLRLGLSRLCPGFWPFC